MLPPGTDSTSPSLGLAGAERVNPTARPLNALVTMHSLTPHPQPPNPPIPLPGRAQEQASALARAPRRPHLGQGDQLHGGVKLLAVEGGAITRHILPDLEQGGVGGQAGLGEEAYRLVARDHAILVRVGQHEPLVVQSARQGRTGCALGCNTQAHRAMSCPDPSTPWLQRGVPLTRAPPCSPPWSSTGPTATSRRVPVICALSNALMLLYDCNTKITTRRATFQVGMVAGVGEALTIWGLPWSRDGPAQHGRPGSRWMAVEDGGAPISPLPPPGTHLAVVPALDSIRTLFFGTRKLFQSDLQGGAATAARLIWGQHGGHRGEQGQARCQGGQEGARGASSRAASGMRLDRVHGCGMPRGWPGGPWAPGSGTDRAGIATPQKEELSEEDAALKEKIELLVDRVRTGDTQTQLDAIEALGTEIR